MSGKSLFSCSITIFTIGFNSNYNFLINFYFWLFVYSVLIIYCFVYKSTTQNCLAIYYVAGNVNTSRQENEIGVIIKTSNAWGWKWVSTINTEVDEFINSRKYISYRGKTMIKNKENFNVTQGMILLLLKKLSLLPNLVFQMILFVTDSENNIGYKD